MGGGPQSGGKVLRGRPVTPLAHNKWPQSGLRRGFRVGSPPAIFDHSPVEYNGRLLRTTNHEPRFFRHGLSSDSNAASPRQTQTDNDASGKPQRVAGRLVQDVPYELRPGRQAPNSMNDERLYAQPSGFFFIYIPSHVLLNRYNV